MENSQSKLKRAIGMPGAVLMGLGSIVGTGIFVSVAIGTGIAGDGIILAIVLAGVLAAFNGLSSAQLAAAHPQSGGTYEYGYRYLNPLSGFTAGFVFLVAKSASAATAVLGCIGYLFYFTGYNTNYFAIVLAGLVLLLIISYLVAGGISRSRNANTAIVGITLFGLVALIASAWWTEGSPLFAVRELKESISANGVLYATAIMFVAYTGYGRIATLGEEVNNPRKTIPRAVVATLGLTMLLYLAVTLTALHVMGADDFGKTIDGEAAPLMYVANALSIPAVRELVGIAAVTAMIGVILNLLLGLSRVILAMGRRGDLPQKFSQIGEKNQSPAIAVWTSAAITGILVLSGNVVFTWSFSAFTVLIYYSITNLSAMFLPKHQRLFPRWFACAGLMGCLFLTIWIEPAVWLVGLSLILPGLLWFVLRSKMRKRS